MNSIFHRLATSFVVFLIPLTPVFSVFVYSYNGHDLARAFQVILGIAAALIMLVSGDKVANDGLVRKFLWVSPVFILGTLSSFFSNSPPAAFRELCLWMNFLVVIAFLSSRPSIVKYVLRWVVLGSAAYASVIVSIILLIILNRGSYQIENLPIGYINYRLYNHSQTVIIPLCIVALLFFPKNSAIWVISKWCCAFNLALLFATVGRGTIVGLAVAALTVGILYRDAAKPLLKALLTVTIIGILKYTVLFFVIPNFLSSPSAPETYFYVSRLSMSSMDARLYLWGLAISMIAENPILGVGPMHYANWVNGVTAHPHNLILQMASEWGIPATLIMGTLTIKFFHFTHSSIVQSHLQKDKAVGAALQLLLIAIIVDSMFSGVLVMPTSQMLGAVAIAIFIGHAVNRKESNITPSYVRLVGLIKWPTILTIVFSQLFLGASIIEEFLDLPAHLMRLIENFPNPFLSPRFWSVGWI